MDLTTAIRTRRSEMHLVPPAPSHEEFIELLELAALSPDHGRLRPWRLILLRQGARHELGMRLSRECGPARTSETATKPLRAPLLATLVFSPYPDHRIPEWEQLSAAVGVANAMMLLLHERGYGSIWRTGAHVSSPGARVMLKIAKHESLLGWLYIGTPDHRKQTILRTTPPVAEKVTTLCQMSSSFRRGVKQVRPDPRAHWLTRWCAPVRMSRVPWNFGGGPVIIRRLRRVQYGWWHRQVGWRGPACRAGIVGACGR
ncbi:MAG: nitroreductase family protein [Pseudonocardiaceae bacterium]